MSNKLCELTDNGFTLTKNVQPEEITLYINYSHPLPPDIETCEQYTIRCIRHIKGDLQFFVQTGPDIIFIEDIEDFLTYLVDKSVPLYDVMRIAERLTSKMSVIQEFLDKIFVSGEASLDYLRLLFVEDVASRDEEGFIQDRFGLTPAFIDELTSDLRKVKVIKGKDSHLKIIDPARNKSEKKR
jgi:hypothetical protein